MLLHQMVTVVGENQPLPEEFWIFCRLVEWAGTTRSGVWQYYEGIQEDHIERVSQGLERFGLSEISSIYRSGKDSCAGTEKGASLSRWIDAHEEAIYDSAVSLIAPMKNCLRGEF